MYTKQGRYICSFRMDNILTACFYDLPLRLNFFFLCELGLNLWGIKNESFINSFPIPNL